jgi:hypothetical protein
VTSRRAAATTWDTGADTDAALVLFEYLLLTSGFEAGVLATHW